MNPWADSEAYAREAAKVESAGEAVLLALMWWRRADWTVIAQKPIEQYRIDLFVPEAGVAIEVDSFAAHGTNAAMERDARKRNLVVARGWAPLAYSAKQALFDSQNTLADILATVGRRLPGTQRRATAPAGPPLNMAELARGFRGVLASLEAGPPEDAAKLRVSPSQLELPERERVGVELLRLLFDYPDMQEDAAVHAALAGIGGAVSDGAVALWRHTKDGEIDHESFLRDCPALLCPMAVECFAMPAGTRRMPLARESVADLLARLAEIGGGA